MVRRMILKMEPSFLRILLYETAQKDIVILGEKDDFHLLFRQRFGGTKSILLPL